jgi:hypothetical protein
LIMARAYKTVADELLPHAEVVGDDFQNRGFRVRVEHSDLGFPYTPTFHCKRGATTIIVELDGQIRVDRLESWVRYAHSCGRDTRIALCLPSSVNVPAEQLATLQHKGIGLYAVVEDRAVEQVAPRDLALNVQLPELNSLPRQIRELLGPTYEQFARSRWREGFEDACQVLETEARRYLNRWSRTGRIRVLRKHGPAVLAAKEVNKMTMGQLAKTFANIQAQNHADNVIGKALATINRDRVGVAHHKRRATTEKRLRTNVGQHMWTIVAALKEMI